MSEISHLGVRLNVVGGCEAAVARLVQSQRYLFWALGLIWLVVVKAAVTVND